jgi:hypothetical protein
MPTKLYKYTRYYQDGTFLELKPRTKMVLKELQEEVNGHIEIVPTDYYRHQKWGKCTVYVNEEGAYQIGVERNPFFEEIAPGFFILGFALKEEACKV